MRPAPWRPRLPPGEQRRRRTGRALFRFRELLEAHFDELARLIVRENGKLLSEARGSLRAADRRG
jgi:acyl-CoA reductase-like NAD-dependent aldehyde dehydrogenase